MLRCSVVVAVKVKGSYVKLLLQFQTERFNGIFCDLNSKEKTTTIFRRDKEDKKTNISERCGRFVWL